MSNRITAMVEGNEDDVRAAFGDLVRNLRGIGETAASLLTPSGAYTQDDVPDLPGTDDDPDEDGEP